jgi:hypothetical protein
LENCEGIEKIYDDFKNKVFLINDPPTKSLN